MMLGSKLALAAFWNNADALSSPGPAKDWMF
jgi:hypothetical protein